MATVSRCKCGEALTMEFEISADLCAFCQTDEAFRPHEPRTPLRLMTHAELDRLLGLHHRRKAS